MSKIKNLSVINSETECYYYEIGEKYRGLLLDRIIDQSVEYLDGLQIIFTGLTANEETVFEAINAPVVINYMSVFEEDDYE